MYKWQIVWCILSVDYNQYNYCRLRMVCSPILHSVQKRMGLICVSFCLWDCTPLQQSSSLPYGKGLLGGQQSPMQACLSQLLSYTLHVLCSDWQRQYRSTAAFEERHKDVHNRSCLKATMVLEIENVPVDK